MPSERSQRVERTGVPAGVKAELAAFVAATEAFVATCSPARRERLEAFLDDILDEVADPAGAEDHWWETWMHFIVRAAKESSDPRGATLADAAWKVTPSLRQHLGPYDQVALREVTSKTVHGICRLTDTMGEPRKWWVGENVYSMAESLFNPNNWYRAIYAGKAPIGFLIIERDNKKPGEYLNSRFMLGEPFQSRGYGLPAVQLMFDWVKAQPGATRLWGLAREGDGSPQAFWRKCGFAPTGEEDSGEAVMERPLDLAHVDVKPTTTQGGDLHAKIRRLILDDCLPGEDASALKDDLNLREIVDSIFELKLVNLLEAETGRRVDAREVFKNLTSIGALMAYVDGLR